MLDKLAHRASGLEPEEVTPHKLRHTFGKSLVDAGVSLVLPGGDVDGASRPGYHRNLHHTFQSRPGRSRGENCLERIGTEPSKR